MGTLGNGMEYEVLETDGVTLLELRGEIDLHASPRLREKLQELTAQSTPKLLLDFAGVEYIDSSGLATLIEYVRECTAFGGQLALCSLQPKVRMVFELVKLDELFKLANSREEGLNALA